MTAGGRAHAPRFVCFHPFNALRLHDEGGREDMRKRKELEEEPECEGCCILPACLFSFLIHLVATGGGREAVKREKRKQKETGIVA